MSDFADITATTPITLSTGRTVGLRTELTAGEFYEVLDLLTEPETPERSRKLMAVFVGNWNLTHKDGSPAPVSPGAFEMLPPMVAIELGAKVDAHLLAYLDATIPESLRQARSADPQPAAAEPGASASSASASPRTRRRIKS